MVAERILLTKTTSARTVDFIMSSTPSFGVAFLLTKGRLTMIECDPNLDLSVDINKSGLGITVFDREQNDLVYGEFTKFPAAIGLTDRGQKRRNRRLKYRKQQLMRQVKRLLRENEFPQPSKEEQNAVWELGGKAHREKLTKQEFAAVILKLAKKRGHFHKPSENAFKPYGEMAEQYFKNNLKVTNTATAKKKKADEEEGNDKRKKVKATPVERTILCTIEEIKAICKKQQEYGLFESKQQVEELTDKLVDIISSRRRSTWDLNKLGKCKLEGGYVLPSYHPIAFKFNTWLAINQLTSRGEKLSQEQKNKVFNYCVQNIGVDVEQLEKLLGVPLNAISFPKNWMLKMTKIYGKRLLEKIVKSFVVASTSDDIRDFAAKYKLDEEQLVEQWRSRPSGKSNFCEKAINNLMPFVKQGCSECQARKAYSDSIRDIDFPRSRRYLNKNRIFNSRTRHKLRNYKVGQSLHFLRQNCTGLHLGNALVVKCWDVLLRHLEKIIEITNKCPGNFIVELCREATQSKEVLKETQIRQALNTKNNKKLNEVAFAKAQKKRLDLYWKQNNKVLHLVDGIPKFVDLSQDKVLEGDGLEIDHMVPRSITMINKKENTYLVTKEFNQFKEDRTLLDIFKREDVENLLQNFQKDQKARAFYLLFDRNDEKQVNELTNRCGIESVSWAASSIRSMLSEISKEMTGVSSRVLVTNGRYTSELRRRFKINDKTRKNRDFIMHHIEDCILNIEARIDLGKRFARCQGDYQPTVFKGSNEDFRAFVEHHAQNFNFTYATNSFALSGKLHAESLLKKSDRELTKFTKNAFGEKVKTKVPCDVKKYAAFIGKDGVERFYKADNNRFMDVYIDRKGEYHTDVVSNFAIATYYQSSTQEFRNALQIQDVPPSIVINGNLDPKILEKTKDWMYVERFIPGTIVQIETEGVTIPYFVNDYENGTANIRCIWFADGINRKKTNENGKRLTFADYKDKFAFLPNIDPVANEYVVSTINASWLKNHKWKIVDSFKLTGGVCLAK